MLSILLSFHSIRANNINVTNISLENLNASAETVLIQFDIGWENSWRISSGPSNWDAAWVFVKYRANSGPWNHASLNASSPGGSGAILEVSGDEVGAMIYRDEDGTGNVNFSDIQLQWDYGENDVNSNDVLDIQIFAIEMVFVPGGSFYVGGTVGTEVNKFHAGGSPSYTSFQITSEDAFSIADTPGSLYYRDDSEGNGGDQSGTLSQDYPKGFGAFYCMKYEVTEGQWLGFFNSLNAAQKGNRDLTGPNGKNTDEQLSRNTIAWVGGSASATSNAPDRPITYVSTADMNAYLDWAALRPMTELEFEKACRGPVTPQVGEFAWGNANVAGTDYVLANDGGPDERVTNAQQGTGNALYNQTNGAIALGPVRAGIFSASAVNSNREETGGSYYGIMELSGNLFELCVTVGNEIGRSFIGNHGDGILTSAGFANENFWPTTSGNGYGARGGTHTGGSDLMRVSDRIAGVTTWSVGTFARGFRGVRGI